MPSKLLVAITGNIGSGKSLAGKFLATLGTEVIDTDALAGLSLLECQATILAHFPALQDKLNKHLLQDIIVNDPKERLWLESLLHPIILDKLNKLIDASQSRVIVVLVPLLFEVKWETMFDITINIACDDFIKLKRIMERNKLSLDTAKKLLSTQIPDAVRNPKASLIITNDASPNDLEATIKQLFSSLSQLAT